MFDTNDQRKRHVKADHQTQVTYKNVVLAERGPSGFPCPTCDKVFAAPGFHKHTHVQVLKAKIDEDTVGLQIPSHSPSSVPITPPPPPAPPIHPPPPVRNTTPASTHIPPTPPQQPPPLPQDDSMDIDDDSYDPMEEVEVPSFPESDNLIRHHGLDEMGFAISLEHEMLICESCKVGVATNEVVSHIRISHRDFRTPPTDISKVCDDLMLPPTSSFPPNVRFIPVPSISIGKGFFCSLCDYVTSGSDRSGYRNHVNLAHKRWDGPPPLHPCSVQEVYRYPKKTIIRVDPNLGGKSVPLDLVDVLAELREKDQKGALTAVMVSPTARHQTPFLRLFRWLELTEGRRYKDMADLVVLPKKDEEYFDVGEWLDKYFLKLKPVVEGMLPLALQWLNTASG